MKKILWIVLTLSVLITGCGNNDVKHLREKKAEKNKGDIKIGIAWPLNDYSDTFKNGLSLALEEINKEKVNNRNIRLVYKDDCSNVTTGMKIANEFAENPEIVCVIGHRNSYISLPAAPTYKNAGILMVTPGSTNPELSKRNSDYFIRTIPSDYEFGKQAAEYAKKKGYEKVVIYYEKNSYGRALANSFEDSSEHAGIKIMDRRPIVSASKKEFVKDIKYWSLLDFDAVFMAAVMPTAPDFIKEFRKNGFDQPVFGGDGLDSEILMEVGGESVEGVVALSVFNPFEKRKKTQDFVEKYSKVYGKAPDMWAAQAYDTLNIVCRAIRQGKSSVPSVIRKNIIALKDYEGVTGFHSFYENGEVYNKKVVVKVVKNGKFEFSDF